jgi:uncharacterized membrane protein YdbT with pleckstrin-like domain
MTDQSLPNGIVYQARLHWILFFWPLLLCLVALYLIAGTEQFRQVGYFVGVFALVWLTMIATNYHFSIFVIKKKQVILTTGLFVRKTLDIPLTKIESIDIRQTLPGSIFQYGTLLITGTGGTRQFINYLSKPLTCRRYIEELLHGS